MTVSTPNDSQHDSQHDFAGDPLTGEMFLGSQRVRGDGDVVHGADPRTGEQLEPGYALGTSDHVDRAAVLAAQAFRVLRRTAPEARAELLEAIAANLDTLGDRLVDRVVRETGIVEARVRGELGRTTGQLRLFAALVRDGSWVRPRIDPALPDRTPLPRPDIRQRLVPLGPVAVFGASNFPLAFSVAGGDTASALAAGCPVLVKAHSAHPGTSELVGGAIADAVRRCGLPEGTFSLLYGEGSEVGTALAVHPEVKAVGFTGSRSGGTALMRAAAGRPVPIPVYAEMSSTNPVFLLPGAVEADPAGLAQAYVESLTVGVGQLCTNPGLVVALSGPGTDRFLEEVSSALASRPALPMLNTGIHAAYERGVERLASHDRVTLVGSGDTDPELAAPGQAHVHTVGAAAFQADEGLHEEVFGAASLVVQAARPEDLTELAASLEGQLTATVHATAADHDLAADLLPVLEDRVGRIVFNGWPTGVDVGHAMVHGGPYPATSDGRSTSVGTLAIERFARPVAYQDVPAELLPEPVDTENSRGLWRLVDGEPGRG